MNFTTMRSRPGTVYNFEDLYVNGINIFDLILQSQNNQAPYAPSLVVATEQYVVARAGSGYDAGDVLYNSVFIDATSNPVTVTETWVNYTKKTRLVPDPILSDLEATKTIGTSVNQTTSISVFTGATETTSGFAGVVPPPNQGDHTRFLSGSGTWLDLPTYLFSPFIGASSNVDGIIGAVPAPSKGDEQKFLRGDGAWVTVQATSPDTPVSNSVYIGNTDTAGGVSGLVPSADAGVLNAFLRNDGVWANIPQFSTFTGTSGTANGVLGLVPAPQTTDANKFLKSDGTWASAGGTTASTFVGSIGVADGVRGLVPGPTIADAGKYLFSDGTWKMPTFTLPSMTGSTATVDGGAGAVPAPLKTDSLKFLRGDGTWSFVPVYVPAVFSGTGGVTSGSSGLVPAPLATDSVKYLRGDGTWAPINVTNTTTTNNITNTIGVSNYSGLVAYAAGSITRYSDGYWYVSNDAIAVATPWAVGTTGATWTMLTSKMPLLTGLLLNNTTPVVVSDTYLTAVGKLQAQITALPTLDTIYTGEQSFIGNSARFGALFSSAVEKVNLISTAAAGALNFDISAGAIKYITPNASANWSVNFRFSATTALNTSMDIGQSCTVTLMVNQGAVPYYASMFSIDGVGVSVKWADGTAPTGGNASSMDSYSFSIIKTSDATFLVLGSLTTFK